MRIHPKYIGIAFIAVLVLVALVVLFGNHANSSSGLPLPPAQSSSVATKAASSDPQSVVNDRTALNDQVTQFVAVYFSFDPQYCRNDAAWKARLRSLVTSKFLATTRFGDCSAGVNAAMFNAGSTVKATAPEGLSGEMNNAHTQAAGAVIVDATQFDKSGNAGQTNTIVQQMQCVKAHGVWRIASLD